MSTPQYVDGATSQILYFGKSTIFQSPNLPHKFFILVNPPFFNHQIYLVVDEMSRSC